MPVPGRIQRHERVSVHRLPDQLLQEYHRHWDLRSVFGQRRYADGGLHRAMCVRVGLRGRQLQRMHGVPVRVLRQHDRVSGLHGLPRK